MGDDAKKIQVKKKPQDDEGDSSGGSSGQAAITPEQGGRGGLDPVRFGDWEIKGKCVDF